jgi:isocitrate dehydrogenase (NAD+)
LGSPYYRSALASTHPVTLIPGDGIGPEVVQAARTVLDAAGASFEWDVQHAGAGAYEREGTALPQRVVESIRETGAALKGPTTTPIGAGFRSPSVELRRVLDLYAGVRPCRAYPGPGEAAGVDLVIVRMNHEDLYAGIEYDAGSPSAGEVRRLIERSKGVRLGDDAGISIKPLSRSGARRVAVLAFGYAHSHGRERVTAVHKASVMRATDGVFLEAVREVAAAHPEIRYEEELVDTACHHVVARPERFDVLVMPTLYGDVMSDLCAALVGGLGMAPGANLGDSCAVFEAVHGSAPKYAGQGRANPMALMLSGVMLLRHLNETEAAARLESAIADVIRTGRSVTFDLKRRRDDAGAASTAEVAEAVVASMEARREDPPER